MNTKYYEVLTQPDLLAIVGVLPLMENHRIADNTAERVKAQMVANDLSYDATVNGKFSQEGCIARYRGEFVVTVQGEIVNGQIFVRTFPSANSGVAAIFKPTYTWANVEELAHAYRS